MALIIIMALNNHFDYLRRFIQEKILTGTHSPNGLEFVHNRELVATNVRVGVPTQLFQKKSRLNSHKELNSPFIYECFHV